MPTACAIRDLIRKLMEQLPEDVRRQAFSRRGGDYEKREEEHMKKFFSMTSAEQTADLDKELDRFAERQKGWESRRKKDAASTDKAAASGKPADDKSGNAGGGPDSGPGGGPRAARTDAQRKLDMNKRLSQTPPAVRVQRSQYFQMLHARATQRGMTMPQFGPRG